MRHGNAKITQTQVVYLETSGVPGKGPGERLRWLNWQWGTYVSGNRRSKRTPRDGVAVTFMPPVHDVYGDVALYMPPTRNLAISPQRLLCWPVAAIPRQLEGRNQGLMGLDYRCTGYSGAQRSELPFHRYKCLKQVLLYSDVTELSKMILISMICS